MGQNGQKWHIYVRQRVYLSHPSVPGGHTWWLESSGALLARGGSILAKSLFLAVVLDVFTGCLSEKVEKIEKKMDFFVVAFLDQKHVETSRNGIKSVKK